MKEVKRNVKKENKEIIKPTLVARQEFIDKLIRLINESGLPLIVVHPILEGIVKDVANLLQQQYEQERTQYESELALKTEDEEENQNE